MQFNYMFSFLKGAEMDNYYNNSETCFLSYVATRDDAFYYNQLRKWEYVDTTDPNNTVVYKASFTNKTLNFTKMLGTNFADSLMACFRFGDSIVEYEKNRWYTYDNSTG